MAGVHFSPGFRLSTLSFLEFQLKGLNRVRPAAEVGRAVTRLG
jgi:hypothetical protein